MRQPRSRPLPRADPARGLGLRLRPRHERRRRVRRISAPQAPRRRQRRSDRRRSARSAIASMRTRSSVAALPAGLRWRLTAWVAGVMVVSAAVVFIVVYTDTGTQLQQPDRSRHHRRRRPARPGAASGQRSGAGRDRGRRPRYLRAQPYTASSTLLFVLVPSAQPASNHPEVFGGGAPSDGESRAEQAGRERRRGQRLLRPHLGYSIAPRPGRREDAHLLETRDQLGGSVRIVVGGRRAAHARRARPARGRARVRARRGRRARCSR